MAPRPLPHTARGQAFTALLLEVFRLNGALISSGNELCGDNGLTSTRWQILGALAESGRALTVSQIARAMGLTRQTVQRITDELENGGFVSRADHPEHGRARLVDFTKRGRAVYDEMSARQVPWANSVARVASTADLNRALEVLRALREQLER